VNCEDRAMWSYLVHLISDTDGTNVFRIVGVVNYSKTCRISSATCSRILTSGCFDNSV
jgi:hypothetical protein